MNENGIFHDDSAHGACSESAKNLEIGCTDSELWGKQVVNKVFFLQISPFLRYLLTALRVQLCLNEKNGKKHVFQHERLKRF